MKKTIHKRCLAGFLSLLLAFTLAFGAVPAVSVFAEGEETDVSAPDSSQDASSETSEQSAETTTDAQPEADPYTYFVFNSAGELTQVSTYQDFSSAQHVAGISFSNGTDLNTAKSMISMSGSTLTVQNAAADELTYSSSITAISFSGTNTIEVLDGVSRANIDIASGTTTINEAAVDEGIFIASVAAGAKLTVNGINGEVGTNIEYDSARVTETWTGSEDSLGYPRVYTYNEAQSAAKSDEQAAAEAIAGASVPAASELYVPDDSSVVIRAITELAADSPARASLGSLVTRVEAATAQGIMKMLLFDLDATGSGMVGIYVGTEYANHIAVVGHYTGGVWRTQQVRVNANGYIHPFFRSFSPIAVMVTNQTSAISGIANTETPTSPKTGESALPLALLIIMSAAAASLLLLRKRERV